MKPIILVLLILLTNSCSTVRPHLADESFRKENHPVRELQVLVAYEDPRHIENIEKVVREASEILGAQTGITLRIQEYVPIAWENRSPSGMLQTLYHRVQPFSFDLAVGFSPHNPGESLVKNLFGTWEGVIDDTFRRYIVMRVFDRRVLAHEVGHAFMFDRLHSSHGLMSAVTLYLVPGIPLNESIYLTEEDRREMLRNKWRDFAVMPDMPGEYRTHELFMLKTPSTTAGEEGV